MTTISATDASYLALIAEHPSAADDILSKIKSSHARRIALAMITGQGTKKNVEAAAGIKRWAEANRAAVTERRR